MDIFVRDNIIHYYLKFYLFFLTVSPSFVSDFLYHETVEHAVSWSQNEMLPVSSILVIFKRSGDQDVVYQTTITRF